MDIEELSTTQIILLALLVSFVTSIATGIVTVSLLAQAPPAVTNTVNQVVERTIETIVPSGDTQVTQTVKETTVVVKEEDLMTDSIAQALSKTGRVHEGVSSTTPVVGLGAQLSSGIILTASAVVDKEHLVSFGRGSEVFVVRERYPEIGIAVLAPKSASSTVSAFRVADSGGLKLGQSGIAVVSVTSERVALGAVSAKTARLDVSLKDKDPLSVRLIETSVTAALLPGAPLVSIFGDLIGVYTSASGAEGRGTFISASDVGAVMNVASQPVVAPAR